MSAKSWPAEKAGPLAANVTPRTPLSPTLRKASVSSSICLSERALRRRGEFIVIVAKSPLHSNSISSYDMFFFPFSSRGKPCQRSFSHSYQVYMLHFSLHYTAGDGEIATRAVVICQNVWILRNLLKDWPSGERREVSRE